MGLIACQDASSAKQSPWHAWPEGPGGLFVRVRNALGLKVLRCNPLLILDPLKGGRRGPFLLFPPGCLADIGEVDGVR